MAEAASSSSPPPSHLHSRNSSSKLWDIPSLMAVRTLAGEYTLSEAVEGRGAHSVVRTAWSKRTREVVAVKCARKRGGVHAARLQAEVAILRQCSQLRHPNLVQVWIRRRRRPATGLHRHAATATTRSLSTPSKRPRRCSWFLSCCLEAVSYTHLTLPTKRIV